MFETRARLRPAVQSLCGAALLLLLLAGLAMVRRYTHDESQYVAATALAAHALPYRDFAYLQTPLQPLLFAPLGVLFPGWLLLGLRLVNAALGSATVILLWVAQRRAGVGPKAAMAACVLFFCCDAFLLSSAVARNDALPTTLLTAALALVAGSGSPRRAALAALCLGAAAADKISFALPAAALLLLAVFGPPAVRARLPLRALLIGFAPGIVLVGSLAVLAPSAFLFEVLTYPVRAPLEWYGDIGRGWKTGSWHAFEFVTELAKGPAILALLLFAGATWRAGKGRVAAGPDAVIFGALTVAGLIAAYLPNPTHLQYLVPLLPPLFASLGLIIERHRRLVARTGPLWAMSVVAGLWPSVHYAGRAAMSGTLVPMAIEADAHRIGDELDEAGIHGEIAGLSPSYFVDAGRPLDPDFSAGPFVFRMRALTDRGQDQSWHLVTRGRAGEFANRMPAAVVTGMESKDRKGIVLDRDLQSAALGAGFEPVVAIGPAELWLRHADAERWDLVNPEERGPHETWETKRLRLSDDHPA